MILDAGGGTLDVDSYEVTNVNPVELKELARPDCMSFRQISMYPICLQSIIYDQVVLLVQSLLIWQREK